MRTPRGPGLLGVLLAKPPLSFHFFCQPGGLLHPHPPERLVHKTFGPRDVTVVHVFDDQGDIGVLLCQQADVQLIVEQPQPRSGQFDPPCPAEDVGLVGVDLGSLYAGTV